LAFEERGPIIGKHDARIELRFVARFTAQFAKADFQLAS
jgi:hypothetical protein